MSIADLQLQIMVQATRDAVRDGRGVCDHTESEDRYITSSMCGYVTKDTGFEDTWVALPGFELYTVAYVCVRPSYNYYVLKEFHPTT